MASVQSLAPNDWLAHPELLPPRPQTFTEAKYTRLFAVDLHGHSHHDQYVFIAPNGLAVVGLAPSHPLIAAHRRKTGYTPLQLQYVPPQLGSLAAEELAAAAPDDDADADAGAKGEADKAGASEASPAPDAEASAAALEGNGLDSEQQQQQQEQEGGGSGVAAGPTPSGREQSPAHRRPECEPFPLEQCSSINFDAGGASQPQGKKRGRGQGFGGGGGGGSRNRQLRPGALLGRVERKGGDGSFPLWAVCGGQLMELNERLRADPGLLYDRPCREGYLAILSPGPGAAAALLKRGLLSEPDYLKLRGLTAEELL